LVNVVTAEFPTNPELVYGPQDYVKIFSRSEAIRGDVAPTTLSFKGTSKDRQMVPGTVRRVNEASDRMCRGARNRLRHKAIGCRLLEFESEESVVSGMLIAKEFGGGGKYIVALSPAVSLMEM